MSIKGFPILLKLEESCQAARRYACLDPHNIGASFVCGQKDDRMETIPCEDLTRAA